MDVYQVKEKQSVEKKNQKVFVVLNPKSGNANQMDAIRASLASHFVAPDWASEIHEIEGKEDLAAICKGACEGGATLIIAAGGDGTVVGVANGLINDKIPLGILPLGTGNDMARVLNIPLEVDKALDLLVGEHEVIDVDVLKVGDKHYLSNVSVGFSPQMMKDTPPKEKKRFGVLAYLVTMFRQSRIFQLHRYTVTIDDQKLRLRATEVLVSNTTLVEKPPHLFGAPETLHDGQLEAYLITAHTPGDYLRLIWDVIRRRTDSSATFHHWTGKKRVRIETDRIPQLVQADGEIIGHTPVEVEILPRALHIVMPKPKAENAS